MSKKKKGRKKKTKEFDATKGYRNPSEVVTALITLDAEPVEALAIQPPKLFGRPPKFDSVEELQTRIDEYFAWCDPHIEIIEVPVFVSTQKIWVVDRQAIRTQQEPYTISGLAVFLDTNRMTLLRYEEFASKENEDLPVHLRPVDSKVLRDFCYTIKKAKARIEGYVEGKLLKGGHPAGPIFNLKNNFGQWEDKTVVDNPAEAQYHKDVAELREQVVGRYKSNKKMRS